MKKNTTIVGILFLLLLGTTLIPSCSRGNNDTTDNDVHQSREYAQLLQDIATLNANEYGIDPQTKGIRDWFTGHKNTTAADLSGFVLGTIGGGSIGAGFLSPVFGVFLGALYSACALSTDSFSFSAVLQDDTEQNEYLSSSDQMTSGEIHNYILTKMFQSDSTCLSTWSKSQMVEFLACECNEIFSDTLVVNSEWLLQEYSTDMASLESGDIEAVYNHAIVDHLEIPELEVIDIYYRSVSELSTAQVVEYTDRFHDLVEDSLIPLDSKKQIGEAVSLTESSLLLWTED